jgi:T3SS (YopN, CesT) and YbjN peptide-binding chaperone 3/T3SS (YopN, CesT) and YbjN peptide-binding chaperone 1
MSTTENQQPLYQAMATSRASVRGRRPGLRSWPAFARRLAETLAALEDEQYLILTHKTSKLFVQFVSFDRSGMRAEAVSNVSLTDDERHTPDQLRRLRALGWLDPTVSLEEARAAGHPDGGGTPNHYRDWPHPVPFAEVAALAAATLHEVMGITTPSRLRYRARNRRRERLIFPAFGVCPEREAPRPEEERAANLRWPGRSEELQRALLEALRSRTGDPNVAADSDGEIRVHSGGSLLRLRADPERPVVHLCSDVLNEVEPTPALLAALNELNRSRSHTAFYAAGTTVTARILVDAYPFDGPTLFQAIGTILRDGEEAGVDLAERFGGCTALEASRPAEPPAASERVN